MVWNWICVIDNRNLILKILVQKQITIFSQIISPLYSATLFHTMPSKYQTLVYWSSNKPTINCMLSVILLLCFSYFFLHIHMNYVTTAHCACKNLSEKKQPNLKIPGRSKTTVKDTLTNGHRWKLRPVHRKMGRWQRWVIAIFSSN